MKLPWAVLAIALAITGCKKTSPEAGDSGKADPARIAKAMTKADEDAAKEKARWTPEITAAAVAARDQEGKDTPSTLAMITASPHRMPGNKDRDSARHPIETLTFFGLQANQTVVELGAGGGWYTELLAPFLANHGKLIVVGPDSKVPADDMTTVSGHSLDLMLAKSPEVFGKVTRVSITPPDGIVLGPAGSADLVLAFREMHNWQRSHNLGKYLAAIHAVLKPGGTFGLVAHRAKDGTKGEDTAETGYLSQQWVIDHVTAAGFELVDKSEINANPKDTKDYKDGVWTLPPNYASEKDHDKYSAIGESDRMTLKFRKK